MCRNLEKFDITETHFHVAFAETSCFQLDVNFSRVELSIVATHRLCSADRPDPAEGVIIEAWLYLNSVCISNSDGFYSGGRE